MRFCRLQHKLFDHLRLCAMTNHATDSVLWRLASLGWTINRVTSINHTRYQSTALSFDLTRYYRA
jgi:hypothetical protein